VIHGATDYIDDRRQYMHMYLEPRMLATLSWQFNGATSWRHTKPTAIAFILAEDNWLLVRGMLADRIQYIRPSPLKLIC
jgi:hypothetical protein